MLAPVIPSVKDTIENEEVYVAQSPDLTGYYPVNPPINKTLNGSFVYFYGGAEGLSDVVKQMELNYQNGLLQGEMKIYTNDGNLYCEGQFTDNKKSGQWKFFRSNGMLAETGIYDPLKDTSFTKCDKLIEPFLIPSYFEYNIDTGSSWEITSAHIIPLLNVGFNRADGRTGTWKIYNENGELMEEVNY